MRDESDTPEASELGDRIRRAVGRVHRRFHNERPAGDLGDAAFDVLSWLHKTGPQTLTALSERAGVAPASMSQSVNRLESDGYVRRIPDPEDRRRVRITTTGSGAELAATTRALRHAWLETRLARLSDADRAVLAHASDLLLAIADD